MKNEYYYEILGINKTANITQIKTAYRQKILQLHPDKKKAPNAAEMLRDVMQAYETLSNDSYRQTYDRQINKGFFIFRKIDDSINHKSCTFIVPGFEACKYDNFGAKIQYEKISYKREESDCAKILLRMFSYSKTTNLQTCFFIKKIQIDSLNELEGMKMSSNCNDSHMKNLFQSSIVKLCSKTIEDFSLAFKNVENYCHNATGDLFTGEALFMYQCIA